MQPPYIPSSMVNQSGAYLYTVRTSIRSTKAYVLTYTTAWPDHEDGVLSGPPDEMNFPSITASCVPMWLDVWFYSILPIKMKPLSIILAPQKVSRYDAHYEYQGSLATWIRSRAWHDNFNYIHAVVHIIEWADSPDAHRVRVNRVSSAATKLRHILQTVTAGM